MQKKQRHQLKAPHQLPAKNRLDKWLTEQLPDFSRAQIQQAIRSNNILVNQQPVRPSQVLNPDDEILIKALPETKSLELQPSKWPDDLEIVHQEKDFLVLNKPAGLAMHPAPQATQDFTVASALLGRFPEIKNVGDYNYRPSIVHRLDKDVSGLVIIALTQKIFEHLKKQFQAHEITKYYIAAVEGRIEKPQIIKTRITRNPKNALKRVVSEVEGKDAITKITPLKTTKENTVLKIQTLTGRTHQIRVHLKHISRPILGDKLYGPPSTLPHILLHAHYLAFKDLDNKPKSYQSAKSQSIFDSFNIKL